MKLAGRFLVLLMILSVFSCVVVTNLFGGVRQARNVNSLRTNTTNVGTNAYANTSTHPNTAPHYAQVNPNYSNGGTVYRGENGAVAVGPRGAVAVGPNGNVATYNGYGAVVTGGYYYDTNDYNSNYYNSYAGTTVDTVANAPIPTGTILEYAPSTAMPLMVGSARYYYDNNTFFAEVFDGGSVVYQVVPAPLGAVITILPAGCMPQYFNGKSFTVCGGTYYQQVAGGYQVVALN